MQNPRDIQNLVRETLSYYQLLRRGERVLVAVSGGADSMALLHLLLQLSSEWNLKIEVAHVNHGFRGKEADAEEHYVRACCEAWSLPCHVARFDVPALRRQRHRSAQETAREVRHQFLRETAKRIDADCIALAHTETDRIETILWHILRGTGTEGLIGFPPKNPPLIRPLYAIRREETQEYCRQWNLEPRSDSSNQNLNYRRNRTRLELLPSLREHYNPEVDSALLRLGEIASEESEYLNQEASRAMESMVLEASYVFPTLVLDCERLKVLPIALQRRVLRLAISQQRGSDTNLSFETIERLRLAVLAGETHHTNLPTFEGWRGSAVISQGKIIISTVQERPPIDFWQVPLLLPGTTELPNRNMLAITANVMGGTPSHSPLVEHNRLSFAYPKASALLLPREAVVLPLVLRSWLQGDRICPRGMSGTKSLQDLFTDAKIPASERGLYPVLVDRGGEGNIWAVLGLRLARGAVPVEVELEQPSERERISLYLLSEPI